MYPFFYFYDLEFDKTALLNFAKSIPNHEWIGPHIGNFDPDVPIEPNSGDGQIWTANSGLSDFASSSEVVKIANYFTKINTLFRSLTIVKTINNYKFDFRPMIQNREWDEKRGMIRTFDIIIPIQGNFIDGPLNALNINTNEKYTLESKDLAFMIPNDPLEWHYNWCETEYDFRYTLHLRGTEPITYEYMKTLYHKDV